MASLGPIELLILQPTPFCNLNCSYCYLPNRNDTRRMSEATLSKALSCVFSSGLVADEITVVWHAGEPLVMPVEFYSRARELTDAYGAGRIRVRHSFQTNATLIDEAWCDFFRQPDVAVGVSVDGPAFLHDLRRQTRSGKPTHARVMEGIQRLQRRGIPFYVITVLTEAALDHPDELYSFYRQNEIERIGFNVEEIEGPHQESSLAATGAAERYAAFLGRFFDLVSGDERRLVVREFEGAVSDVTYCGWRPMEISQEARPFAIVSIDHEGNFSTFSPELLGTRHARYGDFSLGNVHHDSLTGVVESTKYRLVAGDVAAGVERCRETCRHFGFCGGGAPANKVFENGTFDSTETLFCRFNKKAVVDVVHERLERGLKRFVLPDQLASSVCAMVDSLEIGQEQLFRNFASDFCDFLTRVNEAVPAGGTAQLVGAGPGHAVRLRDVIAAVNLAPEAGTVQTRHSAARLTTNEGIIFAAVDDVVLPAPAEVGLWLIFSRNILHSEAPESH